MATDIFTTPVDKFRDLEAKLRQRIVGQDEVLAAVAAAVGRSQSRPAGSRRPIASFVFLGPTGVGKTALAKALAEFVFGSEDAMTRLDMRARAISSPGVPFAGTASTARTASTPRTVVSSQNDQVGQLTEAVRQRPGQVLLFDEIDRAHLNVFDALQQILAGGRHIDGAGRSVDFRDTIVVLTTNAGSAEAALQAGPPDLPPRIDAVVVFNHIDRDQLRIALERLRNQHTGKAP